MNQPQIFNNKLFGSLPLLVVDGIELFGATEAAKALSFSNPYDALRNHVDEDDLAVHEVIDTIGRKQKKKFINESGLYSLIIGASKQGNNRTIQENAKKFKRWVTSEVLPAIRKNGAYLTDQKAYDITHNPDSLADLLLQAGEQLKQRDLVIQEMEPKALFTDAVRGSVNSCLVAELATILKQNGVDIGQNRLFEWLRDNEYLCRDGRRKNKPTQRSMDLKIMDVREHVRTNSQGELVTTFTPLVTGKGQVYFVNKFLNEKAG